MNIRMQGSGERDPSLLATLKTLEPELKRALYNGFEKVHATKAALYLAVSQSSETLSIATSYAFDTGGRDVIDGRDALVSRLNSSQGPVIANGMGGDVALSEILFRHNHQRLLAVPIFGRGRRLVGIVDLRDKAAKRPFDAADIALAKSIADEIVSVLSAKQLYGVGPIKLVRGNSGRIPVLRDDAPRMRRSGPFAALGQAQKRASGSFAAPGAVSMRAQSIIRAARERMARRLEGGGTRRRIATIEELQQLKVFLPAALAYPGVVAAALTNVMRPERQVIVSAGELSHDAITAINTQLTSSLGRGEDDPLNLNPVTWNADASKAPVTASRVRVVASVPVATRTFEGLLFTAAFEDTPEDHVREQVKAFATAFGEAVTGLVGRGEWVAQRIAIAERLVEPDFQRLQGLGEHCRMVAGLASRFATALKLPADTVETVRIAALVHDVGLRLIDYENLAAKQRLSQEQMEAVKEHPLVGAAIVEPLLGAEVSEIVLRHHEQYDGKGYPSRVAGARIPIGARIIAIADVWASLTNPWTYAVAVSDQEAIARLRDGAGTQFDPVLVEAFVTSLDAIV